MPYPKALGFIRRNGKITFESSGPEGDTIKFREEPVGFNAEHGLGYAQLEFGQQIGVPRRRMFEILRKLGWGMNSSVWLAKDLRYAYISSRKCILM